MRGQGSHHTRDPQRMSDSLAQDALLCMATTNALACEFHTEMQPGAEKAMGRATPAWRLAQACVLSTAAGERPSTVTTAGAAGTMGEGHLFSCKLLAD